MFIAGIVLAIAGPFFFYFVFFLIHILLFRVDTQHVTHV